MTNPKSAASKGAAVSARGAKATVTTAFVPDAGAVSSGAAASRFEVPRNAAKALVGRPTNIKSIMQWYSKAFAESAKVGRPVSFRVEVEPDGQVNVAPLEEASSVSTAVPAEKSSERSPELEVALAAARERGRIRAAEILGGSDMLSADAFAELLGTTRVTVNTKRRSGQVLGLDGAKRGYRYPNWQLDSDGRPYSELPALLDRLGAPWAVYRFLIQRHGSLDGLTAREALERGRGKHVVAAAEGIARGEFT